MDITKCQDEECPRKKECYRYMAPASDYQSYFVDSPRTDKGCEYFMGEMTGDRFII